MSTATTPTSSVPAADVEPSGAPARPHPPLGLLYAVTFSLAACSIVYELIIARTAALLAGNTVVWFSVVVGVFLAGMGLGSLRSRKIGVDGDELDALFRVELELTLFGGASVAAIHVGHMLFAYLYVNEGFTPPWPFFVATFGLALAIGMLTGVELPLLMRLARRVSRAESASSTVLGIDYVGSLAGSLLFALVLRPAYPLFFVAAMTAGVNLLAAAWIGVVYARPGRPAAPRVLVCGLAFLGLLWSSWNARDNEQWFLRKYYNYLAIAGSPSELFGSMEGYDPVVRVRSRYQVIDLFHDLEPDFATRIMEVQSSKYDEEPDFPKDHILFLNGDLQFNSTYEEIYHEYFAHVPMMARDEVPHEILLLGGGDGILARELLRYPEVEHILHVDIDPKLPTFARTNPVLRDINNGSFVDPRVEHVNADGFQFLRTTTKRFEAIYIDFPAAADYDLAKLYSREFFTFVRRALTDDGFAVFDATGISLLTPLERGTQQQVVDESDWWIYSTTLQAAGFKAIVPYLTTLEVDDPEAFEVLHTLPIEVPATPDFVEAWREAKTDERKKELRKVVDRAVMTAYVTSLQQGFIMLANHEPEFHWRDRGLDLHALTEDRLRRAFEIDFPMPERVEPARVNSIFRPAFPTLPLWQPRLPF